MANQNNIQLTVNNLKKQAEKFGGKCLSTSYVPSEKIKWECKNGHIFYNYWGKIQQNRWCPYCKIYKSV